MEHVLTCAWRAARVALPAAVVVVTMGAATAQPAQCGDNCIFVESQITEANSVNFVESECEKTKDADGRKAYHRLVPGDGKRAPTFCVGLLDRSIPKIVRDDGRHEYTVYCAILAYYGDKLRIPAKPATYSNLMPAAYSDTKAATPEGFPGSWVDVGSGFAGGQATSTGSSAGRRLRRLSPVSSMR